MGVPTLASNYQQDPNVCAQKVITLLMKNTVRISTSVKFMVGFGTFQYFLQSVFVGICDQKCRNTQGSYECYCEENYSLQNDKKTCKAHFGEATMFFSSKEEIRAYLLRSKTYFPVAKNLNQVVGVDFDGEYVYWTDILSEHESIVRSLKNGEKKEVSKAKVLY